MALEKTWPERRAEWQARVAEEARAAERQAQLPVAVKHVYVEQAWDHVSLGERCEWTDLFKSTCGHCTMPREYEAAAIGGDW
jgi:type II secretory pathway component PulL